MFALGMAGSSLAQPCTSGFPETPLWIQGQWDLAEGASTRVVLSFTEDVQLLAVQLGLSIDTSDLAFDGVVDTDLPGDLSSALFAEPHRINLAYVDLNPVAMGPGDALLSFEVRARRPVDLRTALVLDGTAISPEWIDINFEEYCLAPVYINTSNLVRTPSTFGDIGLYPNPFSAQLQVSTVQEGMLRIWSMEGRLMWSGGVQAAQPIPTGGWPKGMYQWVFHGQMGYQAGRLIRG